MSRWRLLRYRHGDGSSKDWAVTTHADGSVSTRWGKTANRLPGFSTREGIRQSDLERQKQRKGYVFVAEVDIDSEGNVMSSDQPQPVSVSQTLTIAPVLALYWHLDCQATHKVWVAFRRTVRQLIGDLQALHCKEAMPEPDAKNNAEPERGWEGWQHWMDLTLKAPPVTLSGQIKLVAGVMPWLFLLSLKHKGFTGIDIAIVTESSREVSTDLKAEQEVLAFFGTDLDSIREIAEHLELLKPKLNLAVAMSDSEDCWF